MRAYIDHCVRRLRIRWAVIGLALGLLALAFQMPSYLEATDMLAHGISTDAVVIEKNRWRRNGPNRREWLVHSVTYAFTTGNGDKVQGFARCDPTVTALSKGDPIRVVYAAHSPSINDRHANYVLQADLAKIIGSALALAGSVSVIGYLIGFLLRRKRIATASGPPGA